MLKLHNPPRGSDVEYDRVKFYFKRAAATRRELPFSREHHLRMVSVYRSIMETCLTPSPLTSGMIFDQDGNLKVPVFEAAHASLKPDSSPGYPFQSFPENKDVPKGDMYLELNSFMRQLADSRFPSYYVNPSDVSSGPIKLVLQKNGICLPACVHVKSEGTSKAKVARLIYATSCVVQMASRILYPNLSRDCVQTWHTSSHKVGMDMNSPSGLGKFKQYLDGFKAVCEQQGLEIVADDIQGWEYVFQSFMEYTWIVANIVHNNDSEAIEQMKINLHYSEANALVALSDGELLQLPSFIMMSGRYFTHVLNSHARAALAVLDYRLSPRKVWRDDVDDYVDTLPVMTNGDDCVSGRKPSSMPCFSTKLGMVHTDFSVMPTDMYEFCSQDFLASGGQLTRTPKNIAKLMFNYVQAKTMDAKLALAAELSLSDLGRKLLLRHSPNLVAL